MVLAMRKFLERSGTLHDKHRVAHKMCFTRGYSLIHICACIVGVACGLLATYLPDYIEQREKEVYLRLAVSVNDNNVRLLKSSSGCTNYNSIKATLAVSPASCTVVKIGSSMSYCNDVAGRMNMCGSAPTQNV